MNITKVIIAALLLSGITINAKETILLKDGNDKESENSALTFKRKHQPKNHFRLKTNSGFRASSREWNESEVCGSGLFINLGLHFPSSNFLNPDNKTGYPAFKLGYDFELGSFFRFAKVADEKVGIGLRATWLSLSFTSMTSGADIYRALQISPLRIGPEVAIAINETMGVSIFYQLGYNLTEMFGSIDDPNNAKNIGLSKTYSGISHEIGAAFHYKVFSVGLGYRFGKLKNILYVYDGTTQDSSLQDQTKDPINNFRITFGFKF